ncbi:SDR family oxidoreductase [Trichocoleus sp. FACHB-591]|uniref:SDR family oxidoreductase n=1 Tax=Trichocoleus sp. FACHB-591 TaxID=2692872 RepID=UPI001687DFA6|nr:SDR family oxidoreductase [Trichocoleus sp. FACHB-591]MBD2099199.1 SDR family oxidoreductase [Trichocoleus sp. FACHB-591]
MASDRKIAVVTGANRGLGLETSRQLAKQGVYIILTSRDQAKGQAVVQQLQSEGLEVGYHPLDVTDAASVQQLAQFVRDQFGHLEILVNNAGIGLDFDNGSLFNLQIETLAQTLQTNLYGPILLSQALIPLMQIRGYGRVVNVSSGAGQLSEMNSGYPSYRMSKTALNALTRILANELQGSNILVNSVCPGWVRTDMGGPDAPRTPEQGADTIAWLATLPDGGPTGGFFRDRQPIPW